MEGKSEVGSIIEKLSAFSDQDLITIWKSLGEYDKGEDCAPGISMDEWAEQVSSEMDKRGLSK
jgi:hypothetical protein